VRRQHLMFLLLHLDLRLPICRRVASYFYSAQLLRCPRRCALACVAPVAQRPPGQNPKPRPV